MSCHSRIPNGSKMEARAILDFGSSASFVSEHLAQCLHLPHSNQYTRITGVAGFVHNSAQPITTFQVSSVLDCHKTFPVTAVIVSRVTSDLPLQHIPANQTFQTYNWLILTLGSQDESISYSVLRLLPK